MILALWRVTVPFAAAAAALLLALMGCNGHASTQSLLGGPRGRSNNGDLALSQTLLGGHVINMSPARDKRANVNCDARKAAHRNVVYLQTNRIVVSPMLCPALA